MRQFVEVYHIAVERCEHGEWSDAMSEFIPLLPVDRYDSVTLLTLDMDPQAPVMSILQMAFHFSQNDQFERGWLSHATGRALKDDGSWNAARSTSVGDLMRVHGKWWRVAIMGFARVEGHAAEQLDARFPATDRVLA